MTLRASERLQALQKRCDDLFETKFPGTGIPGAQFVALDKAGTALYSRSMGVRQLGGSQAMTDDTMFWIASCTKILSAMTIMKCVEEGMVTLDEDITVHVPELGKQAIRRATSEPSKYEFVPREKPITLRSLMTFTSGVPLAFASFETPPSQEQILEWLTGQAPLVPATVEGHGGGPLNAEPGELWEYGGAMEWSGRVIERITGKRLGQLMEEYVFKPAGVTDITFNITEDQRQRLTGAHFRWPDGHVTVRGKMFPDEVVDHLAGAGLHATAIQFAKTILPLINDGMHPHTKQRVLRPESVKTIMTGQLTEDQVSWMYKPFMAAGGSVLAPGTTKQWGFGCMVFPEGSLTGRGEGTVTWSGWANTHWMADAKNGVLMVIFAQMIHGEDPKLLALRDEWEKIIYDALREQ